jgi:hypothetical protein
MAEKVARYGTQQNYSERELGVRVSRGGAVRKETGSEKLGVAAACLYVGNSGRSRGWEGVLEAV